MAIFRCLQATAQDAGPEESPRFSNVKHRRDLLFDKKLSLFSEIFFGEVTAIELLTMKIETSLVTVASYASLAQSTSSYGTISH